MADSTAAPAAPKPARKPRTAKVVAEAESVAAVAATGADEARSRFSQAVEEARAGAQALKSQAQDTAEAYREKLTSQGETLLEDAKAAVEQAKDKASALAQDGKTRAVEGLSAVSKLVADNAETIDDKLGVKYGDYARSAAKSLDEAATKLEAKDLGELGDDARDFVRKKPGLAVGIAAATGFFLSRLFRGSTKTDA